jgi:hypothetical protein
MLTAANSKALASVWMCSIEYLDISHDSFEQFFSLVQDSDDECTGGGGHVAQPLETAREAAAAQEVRQEGTNSCSRMVDCLVMWTLIVTACAKVAFPEATLNSM